jgi:hypothetical protein
MNEPRLLPKNPNSVTSAASSFAIRALMSSRTREISPGRIVGSAARKTASAVW